MDFNSSYSLSDEYDRDFSDDEIEDIQETSTWDVLDKAENINDKLQHYIFTNDLSMLTSDKAVFNMLELISSSN